MKYLKIAVWHSHCCDVGRGKFIKLEDEGSQCPDVRSIAYTLLYEGDAESLTNTSAFFPIMCALCGREMPPRQQSASPLITDPCMSLW